MSTAEKAAARRQRLLDERTALLARRRQPAPLPADVFDVIICNAGRLACALPLDAVEEVLPFRPCVPVPAGPPALIGLYGRTGRAFSVIDLGAAMAGSRRAEMPAGGHFLVLRHAAPRLALWVERADGVGRARPLDAEADQPDAEYTARYVRTVDGARVLALVDLDRLLATLVPSPTTGA
jgi:purine-binding chemotaxis protein CheW